MPVLSISEEVISTTLARGISRETIMTAIEIAVESEDAGVWIAQFGAPVGPSTTTKAGPSLQHFAELGGFDAPVRVTEGHGGDVTYITLLTEGREVTGAWMGQAPPPEDAEAWWETNAVCVPYGTPTWESHSSQESETPVPKIVNLTPHAVSIRRRDGVIVTYPPSGTLARVEEIEGEGVPLGAIGCRYAALSEHVSGLPDPSEGIIYIVSMLARVAAPSRMDVYSPGHVPRDASGRLDFSAGADGLVGNPRDHYRGAWE